MNCKKIREYFPAYIDGDVGDEVAGMIKAHLKDCEACGAELERMREVVEGLRSMEELEAPPDFLVKVREKIDKESVLRRFGSFLFIPWKVKVPVEALSLALILVVFAYAFQFLPPKMAEDRLMEDVKKAGLKEELVGEEMVERRLALRSLGYIGEEAEESVPPPAALPEAVPVVEAKKEAATAAGYVVADAQVEQPGMAEVRGAAPSPRSIILGTEVYQEGREVTPAGAGKAPAAPLTAALPEPAEREKVVKAKVTRTIMSKMEPKPPAPLKLGLPDMRVGPTPEITLAYRDRDEALGSIRKLVADLDGEVLIEADEEAPEAGKDVVEVAVARGTYPAFASGIRELRRFSGAGVSHYERGELIVRKRGLMPLSESGDMVSPVKERSPEDSSMAEGPVRVRILLVPE